MADLIYVEWRTRPFPRGSPIGSVDELRADLALADTMVADTVIPWFERGVRAKYPYLDREFIVSVVERSIRLSDSNLGESRRLALEYESYGKALLRVFDEWVAQSMRSEHS